MARIRTIKPEFFRSRKLSECSVRTRLTFIGLWTACDDEGRYLYEPELLKADLWPFEAEVTSEDVETDVWELTKRALVCLYEVAGKRYLHVVNWHEHQKINRPTPSRLPECSRSTHGGFPEDSSPRARAREVEVEVEREKEQGIPPTAGRSPERSSSNSTTTLVVVSDPEPPDPLEPQETAQTVLAAYIDWRVEQGITGFDGRTKGQLAKHLGQAFAGGHTIEAIKQGLLNWHHGEQHPATLPSYIDATARGGRSRPVTRQQHGRAQLIETDQALGRWAEERQQAREGRGNDERDRVASPGPQTQRELSRPGAQA